MKKSLVFLVGFVVSGLVNEGPIYASATGAVADDCLILETAHTLDDVPAWALHKLHALLQQPVIKSPPFSTPTLSLPLPLQDCEVLALLCANTKGWLARCDWQVNVCCFFMAGKLEAGIEIAPAEEERIAGLKEKENRLDLVATLSAVIADLRQGWLLANADQCLDAFDYHRIIDSSDFLFFVKEGRLETNEATLIKKLAALFGLDKEVIVGECWPLVSPLAKHRIIPDFFSQGKAKNPYIFIKKDMLEEWQRIFNFELIDPSESVFDRDGESTDVDFTDADSVVSAASSAKS